MATWLKSLRATLDRYPDGFIHSAELFPRLDARAWHDELELEAVGAERGKAEEPPSDSTQPDDVELKIRARIDELRKQAIDLAHDRLGVYGERRARLGILGRAEEVRVASDDAVADFRARVSTGDDEMLPFEVSAKEFQDYLKSFRRTHRLERPADTRHSKILHAGILLIVGLVEILLNLKFFAEGSELFLVGGAIESLIVTAINLGVAWACGRIFLTRLLNGRITQRFVGIIGVTIWLAFLIAATSPSGTTGSSWPEPSLDLLRLSHREDSGLIPSGSRTSSLGCLWYSGWWQASSASRTGTGSTIRILAMAP